jgi:integrase/recombinase XerD
VTDARQLLASLDTSTVVVLRVRAVIAILISTASRAEAVATLRRDGFYQTGDQWMLHFEEKGGKSHEIPVRHELEQMIFEYLDVAELRNARKDARVSRTAHKKIQQLTENALYVEDVCRIAKHRLRDADLPDVLSPHSFRVTTITDLLEQGSRSKAYSDWPATATLAPAGSLIVDRRRSRARLPSGLRFELGTR